MSRGALVLTSLVVLSITVAGCTSSSAQAPTSAPEPTSTAMVERKSMELNIEGRILFVKDGNIWQWEQGNLKRLTGGGSDRQPQWSPDGASIAYVEEDTSFSNLKLLHLASSTFTNLTNFRSPSGTGGVFVYRPVWSPDGTKIAYVSDQTTHDMNLWLMNADGRSPRQLTSWDSYGGGIDCPTWSPDGKQIAFASFRTGVSQIWVYTVATAKWQQLTDNADGAYDPSWSPDGKYIAYTARARKLNDIWLMAPDGTGQTKITADGFSRAPTWSPDAEYLAYVSKKDQTFDAFAVRLQTNGNSHLSASEPKQLTKGQQIDPVSGLSWAR